MSEAKSLNQKFEELDKVKEWFYSDDFNLDEATEKYGELVRKPSQK